MNAPLFEKVDRYITQLYEAEDEALQFTREAIIKAGMPEHSISPIQGHFLSFMAKLVNAKHILELGTLGGYSTIWLARAVGDSGCVTTIELEARFAEVAKTSIQRAGVADRVSQRTGKALDILPQLETEDTPPFDMVFIDADKPAYCDYLDWAVRLCRPGALIIADNVIREGKVLDNDSSDEKVLGVQAFNQKLAEDDRLTSTILQTIGIKEYDRMALALVKG